MTDDRIKKIRAEVERLKESGCGSPIVICDTLLSFIDSLQEEPVSIWHDSNKEQPNFASTVVIWSPKYKDGEIIPECIKVYSDRIWAYIDDLLKI